MNPDVRRAIEELTWAALARAATCGDAQRGLEELARATAERAETLTAYLEGQVAVRAHAWEDPPGRWWAGCDDCGPLCPCATEEAALAQAVAHRWRAHAPIAAGI